MIATNRTYPGGLHQARHAHDSMAVTVILAGSDLARDAGIHPVYLARLFRRYYGTTIGHYVRRKRVRDVIARLDSDTPLSRAAHDAGFADHAHMCRTFRAETGITPSEYRVLLTE